MIMTTMAKTGRYPSPRKIHEEGGDISRENRRHEWGDVWFSADGWWWWWLGVVGGGYRALPPALTDDVGLELELPPLRVLHAQVPRACADASQTVLVTSIVTLISIGMGSSKWWWEGVEGVDGHGEDVEELRK